MWEALSLVWGQLSPALFYYLFGLYILSTVTFIILENRTPQSSFAWMLLFFSFPVAGVLVYLLFGRDSKAFSRSDKLLRLTLGGDLRTLLSPLLSDQDKEIAHLIEQSQTPYERKLLRLVHQNANSALTVHNHAQILQNADQKYPCLIKDIKQARHCIHLEYYIWAADEFTEQIKSLLIDKARAGVEVRLLYDPIGSFSALNWRYIRAMRRGGIQMAPFSSSWRLHTISYRNHRKIAIIDGQVGYLGGLNVGQEHIDGGPGFTSWRDTHLRVVGEAATVLQAIFINDWYNATQKTLPENACYFPPLPPEVVNAHLPVQITLSGPDSQWRAIKQLYFAMILAAEKHVYIQSPFFILDNSVDEALQAAALAGIDVRIMIAPRGPGNQMPYWAGYTYIREMVKAGARVFLYQKGYFHPKTLNIDSKICSIGTANMDIRSFIINYEANAVIYDERLASQLACDFMRDLEDCTEFTLSDYEDRNILFRLRDSLARLLSPLL